MHAVIRMARSGNGMPVFTSDVAKEDLGRPFGAMWDQDRHIWMYPAYFPVAHKVLADFKVLAKEITIELSDTVLGYIEQLQKVEERYNARQLPSDFSFVTKPFDHQIVGLCHAYYMPRSALFYAPGLGKSKVAIDLIRLLRHTGYKDLIVVMGPLVSIRNWGKEINRHSGGQLGWGAMLGTPKDKHLTIERAQSRVFDVLLVTYDTARNFTKEIFEKVPYGVIISDESHLVKEWRSQRTKATYELAQKTTRRLIMTGTPSLGSPMDLYGQFRVLGDCFMPEDYFKYHRKFVNVLPADRHVVLGYKNLDILNERTTFIALRKTKDECLDLPPQTIVDVEFNLTRHQVAIYNHLIDEMGIEATLLLRALMVYAAAPDKVPPPTVLPHTAAMLRKLLQISSGFLIKNNMDPKLCDNAEPGGCRFMRECVANEIKPYTSRCQVQPLKIPNTVTRFDENPKLDALEELLDSTLGDPANKMIIWCYYREELDVVEEKLQALEIKYVRVDGDTGDKINDREEEFNTDPSIRVYLAQISTGVSITLNAAAYMVYYALTDNLKDWLQSLDRNHRIGQDKNVTVYRLLGKQTVEYSLVRLLDTKVDLDTVLTHKLNCMLCEHEERCAKDGVELFGQGCIYTTDITRPIMRPRHINIAEAV